MRRRSSVPRRSQHEHGTPAYGFLFGALAGAAPSVRSASLLRERTQEAFHSAFVMCVSRSQNARQSCKLLPPPPATLGAASVGLVLEEDEEGVVSVLAPPPAVSVVVAIAGESGATDGTRSAGAPIAGAGGGGGGAAGAAGGGVSVTIAAALEPGTDVAAEEATGAGT